MVYDKYAGNDKHDLFIHVDVEESKIKQETYDLCNRVFDSNRAYNHGPQDQIEQYVDYIKTIFKDYKIKGMIVHIKSKNEYTMVTIKDNQVIKFEKRIVKDFGQLNFVYNEDGTKLYTDNNDFNEIGNKSHVFNDLFNDSIKIISNINENYKVVLDRDEGEVITAYEKFFGNYPDLSNEKDYSKVQSMVWLLDRSNLFFDNHFDFTIRYNGQPTSCKLKFITDRIVPFGQTDESLGVENKKLFNLFYSKNLDSIKNMGQIVTDYISRYKDPQEILDNIALTSYIKERMVTKYYETDDIVQASKGRLNEEQVEEILEFIGNLDEALLSDNPYETFKEFEKNNKEKVKTKK